MPLLVPDNLQLFLHAPVNLGTILNSIGDAVLVADGQGKVSLLNPAAEQLTGWTQAEARGQDSRLVFDILHEVTRATVESPIYQALRSGTIVALNDPVLLRRRDGTEIYIDDSAAPIRDERGNLVGAVLIFRDISARRAAEAALHVADERLRLATESANIGTWDLDPVTDTLFWDARCRAAFGYPMDRPIDYATCLSLIHPEDRAPTDAAVQAALAPGGTGEYGVEFRAIGFLDGVERWARVEGKALFNESHTQAIRFVGTIQDITERKRLEGEMRDIRTRLESALLAGEIATWTFDITNNRVVADANMAQLFSVNPGDAAGGQLQTYLEAIHPEDRPQVVAIINQAIESGEEYEAEYRVVQPDGTSRWLVARGKIQRDPEGKAIALPGVVLDITTRKEALEALSRSEARFRIQADAMPQMVWATAPNGDHLYYNRRWYEYTGQTVEESMGFGFALALHPDDKGRTLEQWRRSWEYGEDYEIEYRFRRYDGVYRWFVGRAEPVRDPETGAVVMWAGTCTDIDDLKRVQETLRVREEFLRRVIQSNPDCIQALDLNGNILSMAEENSVLMDYGDVSSDSRVNCPTFWHQEESRTRYEAILRVAREGGIGRFQGASPTRQGEVRWWDVVVVPVLGADGKPEQLLSTSRDITAQHEAEQRERFLSDLTARTRVLLSPEEILAETAKSVGEFTSAHRCLYAEIDEEARVLTVHQDFVQEGINSITGAYPLDSFGPSIVESLRTGNVTIREDVEADPTTDDEHRVIFRALQFRSFLCVPVHKEGRWVAILVLHYSEPRVWTKEEADLLSAVAERTWLALENARLYRAMEDAERKQRRIAEMLQRSMLLAPPEDQFNGLTVGTRYEAAWDEAQVGGDFFDALELEEGKIALVVGDSTGKGLEAARYISELQFVLRAYLRESANPALALERLNNYLVDGQRFDKRSTSALAAVIVAVIQSQTGKTLVAAGGAEPPLLFDAHTGKGSEVAAYGVVLGANRETRYEAVEVQLNPGDQLILTTDGLTEARSRTTRRFFGQEGFIRAVEEPLTAGMSLGEKAANMIADAKSFAGGALTDDVCILIVQRNADS